MSLAAYIYLNLDDEDEDVFIIPDLDDEEEDQERIENDEEEEFCDLFPVRTRILPSLWLRKLAQKA